MRPGPGNPNSFVKKSISKLALILSVIILTPTNAQVSVVGCAANCFTCFASDANSCMSCYNSKVLQNYACVSSCSTGYTADTRDNICKRTMTPYDYPCSPGTFNSVPASQTSLACTSCQSGKFCESYALGGVQADCDAGYYCTGGSKLRSPMAALTTGGDICPEGSYCTSGSTQAIACPGGYYCPDKFMQALNSALVCQAGYYCSGGTKTALPNNANGNICPTGSFCPQQSSLATQCPTGTYLPYNGAQAQSECIACPYGSYCQEMGLSAPTGQCTAGYFCQYSSISATVLRCDQDYYCPTGTYSMKMCPQGEYTSGTGASKCLPCADGNYCRGTNTANTCPNGYYCQLDRIKPCPKGTFMASQSGRSSVSECDQCTQGSACKTPNVITDCAAGFFCTGSTQTERPNGYSSGYQQYGGMCVPGEYCASGLSSAPKCPAGYYCPYYASSTKIQCPAGYYCPQTGTSGAGSLMILCTTGHYCPQGTITPIACSAGYYSKSRGATQQSDCSACPSGYFCDGPGVPYVIAPQNSTTPSDFYCPAGYFCSAATSNKTQTVCSKGYYCPLGTPAQRLCQPGSYQPSTGQSSCLSCPAGQYCDGSDSTVAVKCPAGYYCPSGTSFGNQYPCPPGTYSSATGLTAQASCTSCTDGYYCQFKAQTAQSTRILAGYHANNIDKQTIPIPYYCPQTMYCPEGTKLAISCPNGYWTAWKGSSQFTDCITCPRGKWCKFYSMSQDAYFKEFMTNDANGGSWTLAQLQASTYKTVLDSYYGDCLEGYICLEGATKKAPTDVTATGGGGYPCPVGYYCTSGAIIETPCAPGTWNDETLQGSCQTCTAGNYCPSFAMTLPIPCLAGYYCPEGAIYPTPCPTGTFNSTASSSSVSACLACTATNYCGLVGQVAVTDVCAPGFICTGGDDRPGPYKATYSAGTSGQCPKGQICSAGASAPTKCPAKSYQPSTQTNACEICPPGQYCDVEGLSQAKDCDAGYYCNKNSLSAAPTAQQSAMGGICPLQRFCLAGTSQPQICPDGTIQRKFGKSKCDVCPSGYTCKAGVQEKCPTYKVCASANATLYPYAQTCPSGFYLPSDSSGIQNPSQCLACPSTKFCSASRIVNSCAPGYVCLSQADQHKPNIDDKAYACPVGYYCGEGAKTPISCPEGTFTNDTAAKQQSECTMCQPGKYCNYESVYPQPCPYGSFCPINSQYPTQCPKGTFQPNLNASGIDDCWPCLAGYYCNKTGLGNVMAFGDLYKCPFGSYCPSGDRIKPIPCLAGTFTDTNAQSSVQTTGGFLGTSINDCNFCPEHYYCKKGTNYRFQYPCKDGYLCPLGSADMIPCPAGYYCKRVNNVMVQTLCPEGNYCVMASAVPYPCDADQVCKAGSASPSQGGQTAKDCKPGQYLNINKCEPCVPGFVCDKYTSLKYPIDQAKEGGAECPAGSYCPKGSTTATAVKCPAGTQRLFTGGKTIQDCQKCPQGSASSKAGSLTCVVCGSGSTNNADFTTCQCNGAFRTWQETTNECVCQTGFTDPTTVDAESNNALDQDCVPVLKPSCPSTSFINEYNNCVSKSWCDSYYKCPQSGAYDETLKGCFCNNINGDPTSYCDVTCQNNAVKAYYTKQNMVLLKAGSNQKTYSPDVFGEGVSFDGIECPTDTPCIMTNMMNVNGKQQASYEAAAPFVAVWKKDYPSYRSPYPSVRMLDSDDENTTNSTRILADGPSTMDQAIICVKPYSAVSFSVSKEHFPVYIKQSIYNTDPNYDYGAFSKLHTKLTSTGVVISTFTNTFSYEGVFVFGDFSNQQSLQTIVKVTKNEQDCHGSQNWPITPSNMKKLGIMPSIVELKSYDDWLHMIPPFFIIVAFLVIWGQQKIEARIEARELALRLKREGGSVDMAKYFKKSQDKFDKLEYLADLYKLIRENLDEINNQIAENDRRTEEENRDNMNKMLYDKHSLITELRRGHGDTNLEDIRSGLMQMLGNLRFQDGRSLEELYKEQEVQERLQQEEARLAEIDLKIQVNTESDNEDDSQHSIVEDENNKNDISMDQVEKVEDMTKTTSQHISDPALYDDMLKAKAQMELKRNEFAASIDKSLSEEERNQIMLRYDEQMQRMEREMLKEQEDQANSLKAKLAMRQRLNKQVLEVANEEVQHNISQIGDLNKQIEDLELERDDIEETGINSKGMKKERETELKARLIEVDRERDSRLQQMREDYMNRIKTTQNGEDKERILEEMGERLKSTEASLLEDRQRQEANLLKLLKARQKKNLKQTVKKINNERDDLYNQIDQLNVKVDLAKAQIYAEQGVQGQAGLVDDKITNKVQKIIAQAAQTGTQMNFNGELTTQEKDDLEIEKAQLQLVKEKELKAIDVQVEEELDAQIRKRKQDREDDMTRLQQKIALATGDEKTALLEQLTNVDRQIKRELEEEKLSQGVILEQRRRRKADRMQIRKMRIEHDQLEDVLHKELTLNNNKFKAQLEMMQETTNSLLTKEVKDLLTPDQTNKEQALVLICEINDELLSRILKMLQSKQFFDLSKSLQTMQQQIATDQMIKIKEINASFDHLKEQAMHDMTGNELQDELSKLQAQRIFECQLINEAVTRSINDKESALRQKQESTFFKERKEVITNQNTIKRQQIAAIMGKFPQVKQIQEIGAKMIKKIDMTQEDEIAQLEKEKEEKIERAKLRIIAENEEELQMMQDNLNQAMEREESLMNDQLEQRKAEIMKIKKQNLDDRLRMATGEMSQEQVRLLKEQYETEFQNLDSAIRNEKHQQMQKMRAAMLGRRIEKERKRKQAEQEQEEKKRREAVHRMNAGMAKVFKEFIEKKTKEMQAEQLTQKNQNKDLLKAKLSAWQRKANFDKVERGGEDGEVWNLTKKQEESVAMGGGESVNAKGADFKIEYTVQELLIRIMKVERLVDKVQDFSGTNKEMANIMSEIASINNELKRGTTVASPTSFKAPSQRY